MTSTTSTLDAAPQRRDGRPPQRLGSPAVGRSKHLVLAELAGVFAEAIPEALGWTAIDAEFAPIRRKLGPIARQQVSAPTPAQVVEDLRAAVRGKRGLPDAEDAAAKLVSGAEATALEDARLALIAATNQAEGDARSEAIREHHADAMEVVREELEGVAELARAAWSVLDAAGVATASEAAALADPEVAAGAFEAVRNIGALAERWSEAQGARAWLFRAGVDGVGPDHRRPTAPVTSLREGAEAPALARAVWRQQFDGVEVDQHSGPAEVLRWISQQPATPTIQTDLFQDGGE